MIFQFGPDVVDLCGSISVCMSSPKGGGRSYHSGCGHFKLLHLAVRAKQAIAADRAV
jgi:hypothetical protein